MTVDSFNLPIDLHGQIALAGEWRRARQHRLRLRGLRKKGEQKYMKP